MLGELTAPKLAAPEGVIARWHARIQYAIAIFALLGVALLAAIILSKKFFLGSDSANEFTPTTNRSRFLPGR